MTYVGNGSFEKELIFIGKGHKCGENYVDYHEKLVLDLRNMLYLIGCDQRYDCYNYAKNRGEHKRQGLQVRKERLKTPVINALFHLSLISL